jgi:hypothetical protein
VIIVPSQMPASTVARVGSFVYGNLTLLLQAAPGPKYQAAFATAYGAGAMGH